MARLATEVEYSIRTATPADAGGIARVHVLSWQQSYAGILPATMLDRMSVPRHAARWARMLRSTKDRARVHVVEDEEGMIVGFGSFGPQRLGVLARAGYDAEIEMLYILAHAQQQGLGRRLVRTMAAALSDSGHRGLGLWVLGENVAACAFYERLGGTLIADRPYGSLVELAYGWPRLRALIT